MKELEGKVAIVTGASRGLGKDIAVGLAKYGVRVTVAARTIEEKNGLPGTIQDTIDEIEKAGSKGLAVQTDVTNEESVQEMVQKTIDAFGTVDILVNNAGVAIYSPTVEMPLKRWELTMRVNLNGTFLCSKSVLPEMIKNRRGSIINISSQGRRTFDPARISGEPIEPSVAYETSKGGIEFFTESLAAEVSKHNIVVNCIKPEQGIATEGIRFWFKDRDWSGWATSDAMVNAALFLSAQNVQGVTGLIMTAEQLSELHTGAFPWNVNQ